MSSVCFHLTASTNKVTMATSVSSEVDITTSDGRSDEHDFLFVFRFVLDTACHLCGIHVVKAVKEQWRKERRKE